MAYQLDHMDEFLASVQNALEDMTHHPEIMVDFQKDGSGQLSLRDGQVLLERVQRLYLAHRDLLRQLRRAMRALDKVWDETDLLYQAHRQLARQAFKGDFVRQRALGVDLLNRRDFSGWLALAGTFYKGLQSDPDGMEMLIRGGAERSELEQMPSLLDQAAGVGALYEEAQARMLPVARELDLAVAALTEWLTSFQRASSSHSTMMPIPMPLGLLQLKTAA